MLRTTQTCVRVVSPIVQRHATRAAPLACAKEMSTDASSKDTKTSKKSTKVAKATSAPPTKVEEPVDKGDSYRAGEEFFGYNPYSFYDIENSVQPLRCPQPSSEKAS